MIIPSIGLTATPLASGTFLIENMVHVYVANVGGYEEMPKDVAVSPDGSWLYIVGSSTDKITGYSMVDGELSTRVFVSRSSYDGNFQSVEVSREGLFIYFSIGGNLIQRPILGWDRVTSMPSTGSEGIAFSVLRTVKGIHVSDDGLKIVTINNGGYLYTFDLTAPNDLTNYVQDVYIDIGTELGASPVDIVFTHGGTNMVILGYAAQLYQFRLSAPYDIESRVLKSQRDLSSLDSSFSGITIVEPLNKLYLTAATNATRARVREFNLI